VEPPEVAVKSIVKYAGEAMAGARADEQKEGK
jgi:hypothetical protein